MNLGTFGVSKGATDFKTKESSFDAGSVTRPHFVLRVQIGHEVHPGFYPMDTAGCFRKRLWYDLSQSPLRPGTKAGLNPSARSDA